MYETMHTNLIGKITYFIYNLLDMFIPEEKVKTFTISIPSHVLYRSKLICEYIEEEIEDDFNLDNLLMLLYMNFIKESIKTYNPKSIYILLNKSFYDTRNITISDGNHNISIDRAPIKLSHLEISISTKNFKKGQLILDELYELYQSRFSFSKLLESLWMDFIYSYKTGENKKAYNSIVNMLRQCFQ